MAYYIFLSNLPLAESVTVVFEQQFILVDAGFSVLNELTLAVLC